MVLKNCCEWSKNPETEKLNDNPFMEKLLEDKRVNQERKDKAYERNEKNERVIGKIRYKKIVRIYYKCIFPFLFFQGTYLKYQ